MPASERAFALPLRTGLHRDIVDALGSRIVTGELAPGELIASAPAPVAGMDVSRTVSREAIKVLAAKGLVESRPKVGTRVLPRSRWNLLDPDILAWSLEAADADARYAEILEVRGIIEPRAASLAADRRTADEAERLLVLLGAMGAGVPDYAAFVAADLELHAAILAAGHNALLAQLAQVIGLVLNASQRIGGRVEESRKRSVEEHRAVVEAIVAGDPGRAVRATERLLSRAARNGGGALGVAIAAPPSERDG